MGWRYYCFTIGGLTLFLWTVRFAMPLLESPRFLVGKGEDEEAVQVIHKIAKINRKTSSLTVEQLRDVGRREIWAKKHASSCRKKETSELFPGRFPSYQRVVCDS
jgi:hypothetical protein